MLVLVKLIIDFLKTGDAALISGELFKGLDCILFSIGNVF